MVKTNTAQGSEQATDCTNPFLYNLYYFCRNGEKTEETQAEATEEKNETEAEEADKDKAVENGEAKDTNGNVRQLYIIFVDQFLFLQDRKRVSSAHEEAPVADAEEDAPLTKKSKVEDEVRTKGRNLIRHSKKIQDRRMRLSTNYGIYRGVMCAMYTSSSDEFFMNRFIFRQGLIFNVIVNNSISLAG